MTDPVLLLSTEGMIVDLNRAAATVFGVSQNSLRGNLLSKFLVSTNGSSKESIASTLAAMHGNRESSTLTVSLKNNDGPELPAELSLFHMPGNDNSTFLGILHIPTLTIEDSERLRRLSAIIDASNDAVLSKTLDGTITSWSGGAERMFGYSSQEVIGKNVTLLFPPDRAREEQELLKRLARGEEIDHYETVRKRKDGSLVDVSVSISPIKDASGMVIGATKIARDITNQKRAEKALRRANEKFRSTLENLLEGCQIVDFDYTYIFVNNSAAQQGKRDVQELLGRTMSEVYPDIEQTPMFRALKKCMEARVPARMRNEFTFPDGSQGWFDLRMEPVPEGVFILSDDVTNEHRMDEELRVYREHLEELVRERTAQLESVNKELEAFSYSVSHDLRAPLRHIDGFAGLLVKQTERSLDEEAKRFVKIIADSAKRMGGLIDELLVFSRMGRAAMQKADVDMGLLVETTIRGLQWERDGRRIEWIVDPLPRVTGDPSMLKLVLENLLGNAIKYTGPREKAEIRIGVAPSPEETVFYVHDNGVGFDMKYVDKLFGVFQRLHSTAEFEGSGIGLANVRRIVSRHGGRTWAEGEVGNGATFFFSLPNHDERDA